MDYQKSARQVYDLIGGSSNIVSAAHCATRLRLVVGDENKCDKKAIEIPYPRLPSGSDSMTLTLWVIRAM